MEKDTELKMVKAKEVNVRDWTICEATAQMLEKSQRDGVYTAFDRATEMKPCPIGANQPVAGFVRWDRAD